MSIVYRTTGAWGAGLGQDLTAAQVDGNFFDLASRVSNIESNPPSAVSIQSITGTSTTLTVNLTNGSTQGPFKMPVATFNVRGDWIASTGYAVNDVVVSSTKAVYYVNVAHVSGLTFDETATSNGIYIYKQILPPPNTLLYRGAWQASTAYYYGNLVRVNGIGVYFVKVNHTSQSTFDPSYTSGGLQVYELILQEAFPFTPVLNITTSQTITLGASYLGKWINVPQGGLTIVVPTLTEAQWPIGGEVHFNHWQTDNTADAAVIDTNASSTSFDYPPTYQPKTRGYGAVMTIKRTDTDYYSVFGLLADA